MNVIDHLVGAGREEAELVLRPDSSTGDLITRDDYGDARAV